MRDSIENISLLQIKNKKSAEALIYKASAPK